MIKADDEDGVLRITLVMLVLAFGAALLGQRIPPLTASS